MVYITVVKNFLVLCLAPTTFRSILLSESPSLWTSLPLFGRAACTLVSEKALLQYTLSSNLIKFNLSAEVAQSLFSDEAITRIEFSPLVPTQSKIIF
jgi:hypothetical protein